MIPTKKQILNIIYESRSISWKNGYLDERDINEVFEDFNNSKISEEHISGFLQSRLDSHRIKI